MNGNNHTLFGASLGIAFALNVPIISSILPNISNTPETQTLFVLGGILGGVFPDIDNPTSHVSKLTLPISKIFKNINKLSGKTKEQHRGIMHDGFIYLLGLFLSYLYFPALTCFFVGCLSHLFMDMFNSAGVPFLFGVKHFHLGKISSNGKDGKIFTLMSSALAIVFGVVIRLGIMI